MKKKITRKKGLTRKARTRSNTKDRSNEFLKKIDDEIVKISAGVAPIELPVNEEPNMAEEKVVPEGVEPATEPTPETPKE